MPKPWPSKRRSNGRSSLRCNAALSVPHEAEPEVLLLAEPGLNEEGLAVSPRSGDDLNRHLDRVAVHAARLVERELELRGLAAQRGEIAGGDRPRTGRRTGAEEIE